MLTTLLGPMLPILSRRLELNDSRAGLFFLAQFVGSTLGALLTTTLSFVTTRDKLFAGYLLLTIGTPALIGGWSVALAGVFCYGLGLGFVIPTTNIAIAEQTADQKRGSVLNLLNFAWVCGAVVCGPLIRWLSVGDDPARFLYAITTFVGLVAICFLVASYRSGVHVVTELAQAAEKKGTQRSLASAFWFGFLMFLYVGLENSIAGWAATYAARLGAAQARALLAPSVFWAAILSGRLLSYGLLKRISDVRLFQFAAPIATLGIAGILQIQGPAGTLCATALAGFGLAPIFSLMVAFFTRHFGEASSRIAGGVFALGGVGGALLPLSTGAVSSHFGSLRAGLMLCLAEIFCIALVAWRLQKNALEKH